MLKPGGLLVISTPNPEVTKNYGPNPYHVREMNEQEFRQLLGRHFSNLAVLRQWIRPAISIDGDPIPSHAPIFFDSSLQGRNTRKYPEAAAFVAVCSNGSLPEILGIYYLDSSFDYVADTIKSACNRDLTQLGRYRLQEEVLQADARRSQSEQQMLELQSKGSALEAERQRLENQLTAANQERSNLQQQVSQLDSKGSALEAERQRLENQLTAANQERSNLQQQVSQLDSKGSALEAERQRLENQLTTANQERSTLQQQVSQLHSKGSVLEAERQRLEKQLTAANQVLSTLQQLPVVRLGRTLKTEPFSIRKILKIGYLVGVIVTPTRLKDYLRPYVLGTPQPPLDNQTTGEDLQPDQVAEPVPQYDLTREQIPGLARQALNTSETGRIDHPSANETLPRQPVWVKGWALPSAPLARVDIILDGEVHGFARPGEYRPDLVEPFPERPHAMVGGFEYLLDLTSLPEERSTITLEVVAHGLNGSRFALSPVTVRVGPGEPHYEDHGGRTAQLRARAERLVSVRSKTGDERIRLLAFTHHLGYGGGQLYLYELLRQLSSHDGFACTVVAPDDGPLRSAIEDLGVPVHVTFGYPYHDIEMFEGKVQELMAWAHLQGFNVALVNTVLAWPGPEVAIRLGIPFVWAIHESYEPHLLWSVAHPPPGAHPYVRQRVTDALREAAAVVFEADATRFQYRPYGEPERFITVPYGINIDHVDRYRVSFDRAAARRRLGIPEGPPPSCA